MQTIAETHFTYLHFLIKQTKSRYANKTWTINEGDVKYSCNSPVTMNTAKQETCWEDLNMTLLWVSSLSQSKKHFETGWSSNKPSGNLFTVA